MLFYENLKALCEEYKDSAAFGTAKEETKTYREFLCDVQKYMVWWQQREEKRIGIMGSPSYEWICHVYSALAVGKTVIAIDPLLPVEDISHLIEYADVECVFQDYYEQQLVLELMYDNIACIYEEFHVCGKKKVSMTVKPEDGEIVLFTSGTAADAKAAVIPAQMFWNDVASIRDIYPGKDLKKVLVPLPLHHIFANCMTLLFLMQGRTVYLGNVRRLRVDLEQIQPDELLIVASLAEHILDSGIKPQSLKTMSMAGSVCTLELEEKAKKQGCQIRNVYGATEIGGIAFNLENAPIDHLTPFPGIKIQIDESGIIWLDSAYYPKEYYKKKKETEDFFRYKKITLGDVGMMQEDGTFCVLGRRERLIAMENGDKLYLDEMESQLNEIEGVTESCILYYAKKVVAVIVTEDDEDRIRERVKAYSHNQPYYRKIQRIWIRRENLSRTNVGKIKRGAVMDEYVRSCLKDGAEKT